MLAPLPQPASKITSQGCGSTNCSSSSVDKRSISFARGDLPRSYSKLDADWSAFSSKNPFQSCTLFVAIFYMNVVTLCPHQPHELLQARARISYHEDHSFISFARGQSTFPDRQTFTGENESKT